MERSVIDRFKTLCGRKGRNRPVSTVRKHGPDDDENAPTDSSTNCGPARFAFLRDLIVQVHNFAAERLLRFLWSHVVPAQEASIMDVPGKP